MLLAHAHSSIILLLDKERHPPGHLTLDSSHFLEGMYGTAIS